MITLSSQQTETVEKIRENADIEKIGKFTLTDAMRIADENSEASVGWGLGHQACFLHASALAAVAVGYILTDK